MDLVPVNIQFVVWHQAADDQEAILLVKLALFLGQDTGGVQCVPILAVATAAAADVQARH